MLARAARNKVAGDARSCKRAAEARLPHAERLATGLTESAQKRRVAKAKAPRAVPTRARPSLLVVEICSPWCFTLLVGAL